MEHGHHEQHQAVEPSGAMVREHWSNWERFKSFTKTGIVVVVIVVAIASFFFMRCKTC